MVFVTRPLGSPRPCDPPCDRKCLDLGKYEEAVCYGAAAPMEEAKGQAHRAPTLESMKKQFATALLLPMGRRGARR